MLSVSLILELAAAMLFGIVLPGHLKEVDSLNSPTPGPIPEREIEMGTAGRLFKDGTAKSFHSVNLSGGGAAILNK